MHFDRDKFAHAVHYICYQCRDNPSKLGAVKLNKVLWFAEMFLFKNFGEPLTGESYKKLQFGPVSIHLREVLNDLKADGALTIEEPYGDFESTLYYARRKPMEGVFTQRELSILDGQIAHVCEEHTAASISDRSHDEMWKIAQMNEILPYAAAVVSFEPATEELFEWARQEAARLQ